MKLREKRVSSPLYLDFIQYKDKCLPLVDCPPGFFLEGGFPNPYWWKERTPLENDDRAAIVNLQEQIRTRIKLLNEASEGKPYTNPNASGSIQVNNGKYDQEAFQRVLEATKNEDFEGFLESAVAFATRYSAKYFDKRAGFIDTFSYLFVMKEFPSEGLREYFSHMTLHCGIMTFD